MLLRRSRKRKRTAPRGHRPRIERCWSASVLTKGLVRSHSLAWTGHARASHGPRRRQLGRGTVTAALRLEHPSAPRIALRIPLRHRLDRTTPIEPPPHDAAYGTGE